MKLPHLCLICGYENKPDSLVCAQCGASLQESDPTPIIPSRLDESAIRETKDQLLKRPGSDSITLYIAGKHQPIPIKDTGRVILGRNKSPEGPPKIDLNEYNAQILGVSRQHAALMITHEKCTLEDLGSTNGTWLNENQLEANRPYPLRTGDLIRLGNLLIIVSFYS